MSENTEREALEKISAILASEIECSIFEQHVQPALEVVRKVLSKQSAEPAVAWMVKGSFTELFADLEEAHKYAATIGVKVTSLYTRAAAPIADAAQPEEMIRFCPECGCLGDIRAGHEACCPDWSHARVVPKRFAELCAETFKLCVSQPYPKPMAAQPDERADALQDLAFTRGLQTGWQFGVLEDRAGYEKCLASRDGYIAVLRETRAAAPIFDTALEALKKAAQVATPQDIDSAQIKREDDDWCECPTCGGEGSVKIEADYCNYDGTAIGVQFYGIGNAHGAAEAYFRAANPATVLALIERLERAEARAAVAQAGAAQGVTEDISEGIEILDNLIDSVRKHGNYSPETTLTFLSQARQCFASENSAPRPVSAPTVDAASGDSETSAKSYMKEGRWCPDECPITGKPFFMWMDHPELGYVPTYGGPFDSYTIAAPNEDGYFRAERYDHDRGEWIEGGEPVHVRDELAVTAEIDDAPVPSTASDAPAVVQPSEAGPQWTMRYQSARRFRHLKTGGTYRLMCYASMEADCAQAAVYESEDDAGRIWVRPHVEFFDGRFEELEPVLLADLKIAPPAVAQEAGLTDEQIKQVWKRANGTHPDNGAFGCMVVDFARALLAHNTGAQRQGVTVDAIECLRDVVSHHDNIIAGFAAQRLDALKAGDSDSVSYWLREINVAHRMKSQAVRALAEIERIDRAATGGSDADA